MTIAWKESELDVSGLSVSELLGAYARILAELRRRGVVRTNNAPAGDYAELLIATALDGTLATSASEKSWDVACAEFGRVQVKARVAAMPVRKKDTQTSPFRSWDFDFGAFLLIDLETYDVVGAWMVPVDEVRAAATWRTTWKAWATHIASPLLDAPGVVDITDRVQAAAASV